MKLTSEQVGVIESQTGAHPIPAENPANETLVGIFGDHTFYADMSGLHVLEEVTSDDIDGSLAEVIQIAEWANEDKSELQPVEPKRTGAVLGLDADTAAAMTPDENDEENNS